MTVNRQPIYPGVIKHPRALLIAQTTPRIITTETPVTLYDGSSNQFGAVLSDIVIKPLGNNIATVVRIYSQLSGFTSYQLLVEHTTTLVTGASDTAAIAFEEITLPKMTPNNNTPDNRGIRLEAGESLFCSLGTAVATGMNVFASIGEF